MTRSIETNENNDGVVTMPHQSSGSLKTTDDEYNETSSLMGTRYMYYDEDSHKEPIETMTTGGWFSKLTASLPTVMLQRSSIIILSFIAMSLLASNLHRKNTLKNTPLLSLPSPSPPNTGFPSNFLWGSATSSYQIEGATNTDHRGPSIWDTFCHSTSSSTHPHILHNDTGDTACDHYHLYHTDLDLMSTYLHLPAYRFSISWTRILPQGTRGAVNPIGVAFYSNLIDELLRRGIEPWVTLYHWDLPQALEDEYGGWLDRRIVEDFGVFATICFKAFGGRVKRWITINEGWTVAVNGYSTGVHAPGHTHHPATEPYIVGHHLLLAHAHVYHIYHSFDDIIGGGIIGISHSADFRYPAHDDDALSAAAAQRAMEFQLGWFHDPIVFGDYPQSMRERLGDRLPQFTTVDRQEIIGSCDFLGVNHYSSLLASPPAVIPAYGGYWADIFVDFDDDIRWNKTSMGWNIVPEGMRDILLWIRDRYDNPVIYVTENGVSFNEDDDEGHDALLNDVQRRDFFEGYIRACREAIERGVDLRGYFAWSLMDNFEWQFGYERRFGMIRVDFETLERMPKLSAGWYREAILTNGGNIGM